MTDADKQKKSVQQFNRKLSGLKRRKRFVDWRASASFIRELETMLQNLKVGVDDPLMGVEAVAAFYTADTIFNICDDSNGYIGGVFRCDAKELFLHYATLCTDKEKIAEIILEVNKTDPYGVRDTLIECAGECLPKEVIRTMIATLQKWIKKEKNERGRNRYLLLIELLAEQIGDAELFEKTRIASWGKLSTGAFIHIARVYLKSGDAETAQSWLKKIPKGDTYMADQRDELQEQIYQKQGKSEQLEQLLFQKFREHHSIETLEALLDVIGHGKRDKVLADGVKQILKTDRFVGSDAEFLIAVGKIDEAEAYLLGHADQLKGCYYGTLLSLVKAMESENRHLAATLIYRSLLLAILERGYAKAYSHGVRYLKKLDKLATSVSDWKGFDHHDGFKQQITEAHGRKTSFWSKYESRS